MGEGRRERGAVHPAGAAGDRPLAQDRRTAAAEVYRLTPPAGRTDRHRPGRGREDRHRPRARRARRRRPGRSAGRRGARGRAHRSRLGAGHAPGRGHRDRSGRTDGARRDRVPRVRPAVHRGHRDGDDSHPDRRSGDRVLRRRRAKATSIRGILPFAVERIDAAALPATRRARRIMLIVGDPGRAFALSAIPNDGVGLARIEFIITNDIGIHPMALARYPALADPAAVAAIAARIGDEAPAEFFVRRLAEGVGRIAAAFFPKPVIVRTSDFKTNEYASLLGGREFEPTEENPMIGFRGASRYYDPRYAAGFALECRALRARARRDGPAQREGHDSVLPHGRGRPPRARRDGGQRAAPGRERPRGLRDVRDPGERRAGRGVPARLRRLLDRVERSDAAHARARPRFRDGGASLRRAQWRRALDDRAGHRRGTRAPASRSASAARRPPTTRTSRRGWSSGASTRSP